MARKAYSFIEYTFAESHISEVEAPIVVLKNLLDNYIADTNNKGAKVVKDFVFDSATTFGWNGNKGAVSLEFINERTRQTFFKAREDFVAWLETQGVVVSHSASCDMPIALLGFSHNPNGHEDLHAEKLKEYFKTTLPAERGFTAV